jgi:hypothetical protein
MAAIFAEALPGAVGGPCPDAPGPGATPLRAPRTDDTARRRRDEPGDQRRPRRGDESRAIASLLFVRPAHTISLRAAVMADGIADDRSLNAVAVPGEGRRPGGRLSPP